MADIELVIKIPENMYNMIKYKLYCGIHDVKVYEAIIRKGIPLPKGHGRLKDVDRLESHDEYDGQGFTKSVYKDDIDNLQTIIVEDALHKLTESEK